jgi:integrase/recombinase XerD
MPSRKRHAMKRVDEFEDIRGEFFNYLTYTRNYSPATCYAYSSDLSVWCEWLASTDLDWTRVTHVHIEQFIAWQMRTRNNKAHIVARRNSTLSTFYRWCLKHEVVARDPVQGADKPKRPHRIPVWLEPEEQGVLEALLDAEEDLPRNLFGKQREDNLRTRRRYRMLFRLILISGLRISEALHLKVSDVSMAAGIAKSLRVIGKGNKERIIPLPERIGPVLGDWIGDAAEGEFVFAMKPGGKSPGAQAARAYLRRLLDGTRIRKRVTPHKLRHTYATRLKENGAELTDIRDLLGHADISTTSIYTHVSEDRKRDLVSKL